MPPKADIPEISTRQVVLHDLETRPIGEKLLNTPITADTDPVKVAQALEATCKIMLA
jgi:hypothetical protein